jgi:hypothetical protein
VLVVFVNAFQAGFRLTCIIASLKLLFFTSFLNQ